ncbi:MAG: hypothetical protein N3E36_04365 [Sulfolobales archaeon]|nr:hypothetical protein [Sulfolobales archaeon]
MSLTWEPKWEAITIEYEGVRIKTCRDRITGMIACPICINAASTCLEGGRAGFRSRSSLSYVFFFTAKDLIHHLKNHHESSKVKPAKIVVEEEEVEEE